MKEKKRSFFPVYAAVQFLLMAAYGIISWEFIPVVPKHWSALALLAWTLICAAVYVLQRTGGQDSSWKKQAGIFAGIFGLVSCLAATVGLVAFDSALQQITASFSEEEASAEEEKVTINWEKQPVLCYISGIEGKKVLEEKAKRYSDVNLLAAVDPESHQILLVNTPRDTLLAPPGYSELDKLDAMVLYGKTASKEALEQLYQVQIDCYVRADYAFLRETVDALGGVEAEAGQDFVTDWGPAFKKGMNHVDGTQALAFVRERHHLSEGDVGRGKNQQQMIRAILAKLSATRSPEIYKELLSIAKKHIRTDLSARSIEKLVQWQLEDEKEWTVESMTLEGTDSTTEAALSSVGKEIYVYEPYERSVKEITNRLNEVLNR